MDDEGAASALAFISAGLLFLGVMGIMLTVVVQQIPPPTAAQSVTDGHGLEASGLLARFVSSQGTMEHDSPSPGWEDGPDADEVPGLLASSGKLSLAKVADLTQPILVGSSKDSDPSDPTPGERQLRYSEAKHQLRGFLQYFGDGSCDKTYSDFQVRFEFADGTAQAFGPDPPVGAVLIPAKATLRDELDRSATVWVFVFDSANLYGPCP